MDNMNRMEGKVACVTGAASGIGRASAGLFLRHAHVVVADFDEARGDALAREWPGRARIMRVDVRREEDVAGAVDTALSEFGRLDCMFNNAGMSGRRGPIADIDAPK